MVDICRFNTRLDQAINDICQPVVILNDILKTAIQSNRPILNRNYLKIQINPDYNYGTVTKESIKTTQRQWIKYRDAWITFCKSKYPAIDSLSLKTWLTNTRIEQLQGLMSE